MATDPKFTISAEDRFSGTFTKLKRDIAASKDGLESLASVAGGVNAALGRIAFGSVVGAAGFAAGVVQIARGLDDLNDASAATGATVERLSALDRVARENGGNLDTVSTSLLRLNTVLREAKPDSPGAKALEAISLSAKQLRELDPADALKAVADALAQYADDGNKARILQELFGKSTKETAGFLKDLAESGQLNARVTTEQAQAAEKFVKNLNELKANAEDAGRSLANILIPAVNDLVRRMAIARETFGGLGAALLAGTGVEDAAQGLDLVTKKLADLRKEQKQLADSTAAGNGGGFMSFLFGSRTDEQISAEIAKAEKLQGFYERVLGAQKQFAGGGRGFVNPDAAVPQPRLPDISGKSDKDRTSEAERFLDSLQRRIQAEQKLTAEEQARLAIEKGLDGLTPAIRDKIINAARFADALDEVNKALEQQKNFEDLLAKKRQEDITSVQRLLEATPTGQRQKLVIQGELVLDFARRNAGDDQIQKQAKEALEKLNAEMRKIGDAAEAPQSQFEKLADTIEKTMERSTDAVLDFVVEGKGGMGSLVKAFARDILRQQIESPIRDTFKGVADVIRKSLQGLGSGDFLSGIADFFKKLFGGGGGGGILGALGSLFGGSSLESGGFTGRASGGAVKAGQLVRWQENGREWFIPQTDGTVVKGSQATAGGNTFAPVINVNGDVGPQTVALIQAMVAKQQAQWMRSMRTGGAMSPV